MLDLIVPQDLSPMPIKKYLHSYIGLSLTIWRKIKNTGSIIVNGKEVTIAYVIEPGDIIALHWLQPCDIVPTNIPLDIAYEDDTLLIINKPAGMLIHPTTSEHASTLGNAIMYYFHKQGLTHAFHPVHRLDRNTSGLVLIAKYPHIQHLLSLNGAKNINRQYLALATGILKPSEGIIDAPIARHPDSIIQRIVDPNGQAATTCYQVLKPLINACVVQLTLLTGRTHQIRVHLSHLGHPIIGDDLYGGTRDLIARQALHAARLYFTHPLSGKVIDVASQLPNDISNLIDELSENRK